MDKGKRTYRSLLLFLFLFLVLVAVMYWTGLFGFFFDQARMTHFLESLGPWSFAGFIFLQIVQVIAAPIPGEVSGFVGGYLFGPLTGILLSTIGLTVGSIIAFKLSRSFGKPLVDRLVDPRIISRFDFLLHDKGAFLVFVLFLLPGFPKDYLCYILGLGTLSLLEFTVISATGRLAGTTMLTFGGSFLRQGKYLELFFLTALAVIIIILVIVFKEQLERWFRAISDKNKEASGP